MRKGLIVSNFVISDGVSNQGVLDKIRGVDTYFQQKQTCPDLQVKPDKFVTAKFRVENQCPLPQLYIGLPAPTNAISVKTETTETTTA